jgi:hypothetical protein
MKKIYSATTTGKNNIIVFDVESGVRAYSLNLGNVTIINGPVITRDKLTVVVEDKSGNKKGKVYSLKTGVVSYSFDIK